VQLRKLEEVEKKWVLGEFDFVRVLRLIADCRKMQKWTHTPLNSRTLTKQYLQSENLIMSTATSS
jgi:hypothetical protein